MSALDVKLEVKCSRKGKFHIKERDLKGLSSKDERSHGYLTVLITSNAYAGPRWILVPVNKVVPKTYSEKVLTELSVDFDFWQSINDHWGSVLLDAELIDKLLSMPRINFKSMDWWNMLAFKPQEVPKDVIWKIKVKEALDNLRERLTREYKTHGARREGFIHQCILCFCLIKAGYETVSNITGVPDLRTQIAFK